MSTHLWFRRDEVSPITEHTMACPEQHITRAQVLAGAAQRPALIWTRTGEEDLLSSNGVPIWYDTDGAVHAAAAHTWRHTATGRHGGTAQPDPDTAYLPLDRARDQMPVIDALRDGRHTGRHWVVIDIDPTGGHLIRPDAVRLADHRDEIAPPDATWQPATVTAAALAHGEYPALIADGYTVRGGEVDDVLARFDRSTVERMVADLHRVRADTDPRSDPMPGEFAVLHLDGDVLVVSFEHDDGEHTRLVEIERVYPDAEGYYSVGAYVWPWQPTGGPPGAAAAGAGPGR